MCVCVGLSSGVHPIMRLLRGGCTRPRYVGSVRANWTIQPPWDSQAAACQILTDRPAASEGKQSGSILLLHSPEYNPSVSASYRSRLLQLTTPQPAGNRRYWPRSKMKNYKNPSGSSQVKRLCPPGVPLFFCFLEDPPGKL